MMLKDNDDAPYQFAPEDDKSSKSDIRPVDQTAEKKNKVPHPSESTSYQFAPEDSQPPQPGISTSEEPNDQFAKDEYQQAPLTDIPQKAVETILESDAKKLAQTKIAVERFIPSHYLKFLNKKDITEISLNDCVEIETDVLFIDIRSFVELSERYGPIEMFGFVNEFVGYLQPHIPANKGFIDKFIGDAFMALFPVSSENSVKAGLDMLRSLEMYNHKRIMKQQKPVQAGIGINRGVVALGVIGFYDRMECTVISSVVNMASRIEQLTKKIGANFLITDEVFASINMPGQFNYRFLGHHLIRGLHQEVKLYEIFDADPEETLIYKRETKKRFEEGVRLIRANEREMAQEIFKEIVLQNAKDLPAKYFLEMTSSS